MMKILNTLFFLIVSTFLFAQTEVLIKGQIFNSNSSKFTIYQNTGKENKAIAEVPMDEKGFFEKKVSFNEHDYYFLSLENGQNINLIYAGEDSLKIYGDGRNLFYFSNIVGSEASTALNEFARINAQYQQKLDSANKHLQANMQNQNQIRQEFAPVMENFKAQRQQFMNINGNSPALIGVLSSLDLDNDWAIYERVVVSLQKTFKESPTVQRIAAEYANNKKIMMARNPLQPGNEAKEISLPNPEGEVMNLSDLRGKYVLIDFWASWCGPCRRENPNVVKLYHKYKDKGFEVFSVSLDKSKDAWEKAIEHDGLEWDAHVSDLKYWQSEAAKAYGVSSIPTTVLIDKEGKVIQANLRGDALAQKLEELLGN